MNLLNESRSRKMRAGSCEQKSMLARDALARIQAFQRRQSQPPLRRSRQTSYADDWQSLRSRSHSCEARVSCVSASTPQPEFQSADARSASNGNELSRSSHTFKARVLNDHRTEFNIRPAVPATRDRPKVRLEATVLRRHYKVKMSNHESLRLDARSPAHNSPIHRCEML